MIQKILYNILIICVTIFAIKYPFIPASQEFWYLMYDYILSKIPS